MERRNNNMWIYKQTEFSGKEGATNDLFTVGHYDSDGKFQPIKDFNEEVQAVFLVNYLNGGKGDITLIKDLIRG